MVNAGTYESSDPTETLDLHEPGSLGAAIFDADFLLVENGVGPSAFDDPGDPAIGVAMASYRNLTAGPMVGSATVAMIDEDMDLMIPIAPGFLNGFLGGPVVIGGELSSLTATGTPEAIMGFTGPDIPLGLADPLTPSLVLTLIPEPVSTALALLAVGLTLCQRRNSLK